MNYFELIVGEKNLRVFGKEWNTKLNDYIIRKNYLKECSALSTIRPLIYLSLY